MLTITITNGTRYWTATTMDDIKEAGRQIAEEVPGRDDEAEDAPARWTMAAELEARSARRIVYSAVGISGFE